MPEAPALPEVEIIDPTRDRLVKKLQDLMKMEDRMRRLAYARSRDTDHIVALTRYKMKTLPKHFNETIKRWIKKFEIFTEKRCFVRS